MNNATENMDREFLGTCKKCGSRFYYSGASIMEELRNGSSPPSRCPKCRQHRANQGKGDAILYLLPPRRHFVMASGNADYAPCKVANHSYDRQRVERYQARFSKIDTYVEDIVRYVNDPNAGQVSILAVPTGWGKSTWFPYKLLKSEIGRTGKIVMTQPRTVTLRSSNGVVSSDTVPGFIAHELLGASGVGAGHEIGVLYRSESTLHDKYNRLLFVTDGILIRWLISGEIKKYDVIILDEAHEQSANMELIFALIRSKLVQYPRLKLVITSATINESRFVDYFMPLGPVHVAKPMVEDKTRHEIHDRWPDGEDGYATLLDNFSLPVDATQVADAVSLVVDGIVTKPGFTKLGRPEGDILVFVPTIKTVDQTIDAICKLKLPNLEAIACHAQLDHEQYRVFLKSESRARAAQAGGNSTNPQRVIIATNYAETSVTLSNLCYVIDSGLIAEPVWDPDTCSYDYTPRKHSKAGCTQRKGRVGRDQPGEVFRLYDQGTYRSGFSDNPEPAINKQPRDRFILSAMLAGENPNTLELLGDSESKDITLKENQRALGNLRNRGLLTDDGQITNAGVLLERIETSCVDNSHILATSDRCGCILEIATFLAFVETAGEPFLRNSRGDQAYLKWSNGCYDDLEFHLRIFNHWAQSCLDLCNVSGRTMKGPQQEKIISRWASENGLNYRMLEAVSTNRNSLLRPFVKKETANRSKKPTLLEMISAHRTLDIERLHRARLIIARSIPEWVYVRRENTAEGFGSVDTYYPQMSIEGISRPDVQIARESSCLLGQGIESFVSLQRQKVGDRLLARHIVRVNPQWLNDLSLYTMSDIAHVMQEMMIAESSIAAQTAKLVMNECPEFSFDYDGIQVDDLLTLKVLRTTTDSDVKGQELIARNATTNKLVFVNFGKDSVYFAVGTVFRGHLERVLKDHGKVVLTQKRLPLLYQMDEVVRNCTILKVHEEGDGQFGYLVELEPGVKGVIRSSSLGAFSKLRLYNEGQKVTVRIRKEPQLGKFLLLRPAIDVDDLQKPLWVVFQRAERRAREVKLYFRDIEWNSLCSIVYPGNDFFTYRFEQYEQTEVQIISQAERIVRILRTKN